MAETETKEVTKLIAVRVPPGDRWQLVDDSKKEIHPSIIHALESYFMDTQFKGDYKISPSSGKIFKIDTVEEEIIPPSPEIFDIYGERNQ